MMDLKKTASRLLAASLMCCGLAGSAMAEGDLSRQDAIVVNIDVGAEDGTKWSPSTLELETGKLYRFVFNNSSEYSIYVKAPDLVSRIFTRKVQSYGIIDGEVQRTAEVKGYITEFEVFAGQQIDWWFVPIQTSRDGPIAVCCTTEDDAVAATVTIK